MSLSTGRVPSVLIATGVLNGNDQTRVAPALLPVLASSRRTLRHRQECPSTSLRAGPVPHDPGRLQPKDLLPLDFGRSCFLGLRLQNDTVVDCMEYTNSEAALRNASCS